MIRRDWSQRFAVVLGYVLLALAFVWPLPLHLTDALTGDPTGDTGVYVWNQWVFHHELSGRRSPMSTETVLSLTGEVDLSQHNYTVFLNLLAWPLIDRLGIVAAFNLVLLAMSVLTALATYALARQVTSASRVEAWLAGAAFAWSPILVARSTAHFSLVAAAPLAAFILTLIRADRSRRPRDAALAGLCMAWAGLSDAYYAVYCLMIAVGFIVSRLIRVRFSREPAAAPLRWALDIAIVSVVGLVVGVLAGHGGRFELLGVGVSVRGLYTPVLLLTGLMVARAMVYLQPRLLVPGCVPT